MISSVVLSADQRIQLIGGLVKIDNKEGQVVPFNFNRGQRYFYRNKTNRNIILKHRQGGWSSGILADMFIDCIFVHHTECAVVSHEGRATQRLLDRVQFYYDGMDEPKPRIGAESRTEKSFPDMHSSIYIGTAGSRGFGRGDTIRKALLSELAFYEDGEKILNGVEDAVPMTGELTIECTPNGEGNAFHEKWTRAREGKSPYKPFFFPWWWTDDYRIPYDSEYALPQDRFELSYSVEEEELVANNPEIQEDQLRWRRWKIGEKQGLFWQEFPEDEVSCFITVGDPVFDTAIITSLAGGCYEGTLHPDGWTEWIPPDTSGSRHYTIGADTSAGSPTGSFSAACVLDDLWQVVATFQARVEPNVFAGILKKMAVHYNMAEIAPERNFTGYAVLAILAGRSNLESEGTVSGVDHYPHIYRQRDYLTGKITKKLGWWTDEQTKGHMRTALRDRLPQLKIWDANLVRQLRSYRYIKMKPTAQSFDDLAIALMISCAVRNITGIAQGYRGSIPGYSGKGWD